MSRRRNGFLTGKRAVCAGLFLGVVLSVSACTKPVVQPGVTGSPEPSPTAEAGQTPAPGGPTQKPVLTDVPVATPADVPSGVPSVTGDPQLTPTGLPEITTGVTANPSATPVAEPTGSVNPDASPTPEPTGQPEYGTLLQSGWQRTEDFFGRREVFFSGKFDRSELIAVPGRYEYRYTSSSDSTVSFSVIGEEGLDLQQFLDDLIRDSLECYIEMEGPNDYWYLYTEGTHTIEGRVYDCSTDTTVRCMRTEFRSTVVEETLKEGHEFYLKETVTAE